MSENQVNEESAVAIEDAQAKALVELLDANAQRLSMRTIKQLERGREKAVKLHAQRLGGQVNADGTISGIVSWLGHHQFIFASLVLLTIVCSVLFLQNLQPAETSDAFLLSAELPPEAFVDLGFEPSLNQQASL